MLFIENSYTNLAKWSCIYFLIHDLGYPVLSDPQSSLEFPVDKKLHTLN